MQNIFFYKENTTTKKANTDILFRCIFWPDHFEGQIIWNLYINLSKWQQEN